MTEANFVHEFSATSSVQDFKFRNVPPAPAGYPDAPSPDTYSKECIAPSYEERRALYVDFIKRNPGADFIKGLFYELVRIEEGITPVHEGILFAALDYIDNRHDCADFVLVGILRCYYQLLDSEAISEAFKSKAKDTILSFKYWPDEPGIDSMCYWTENHHIIFSSCEYLAGQLFPDETFTNSGLKGAEKQTRAKQRIDKWLELRFYTGFNEWLSNVYYDENLPALLNLLDFAEDKTLAKQANNIIDLMLYDMALNSYYGLYACTHGRIYTKEKLHPFLESTTDTAKLMFGIGTFANEDNMSAAMFTLSKHYTLPQVIFDIANASSHQAIENKQRVSINFKDAKKWGYGKKDLESAMGLLSFGGYCHPRTFNHMVLMLDEYKWWDNQFFNEFAPFKKSIQIGQHIGLTKLIAWVFRKDMSRNALEENNIYTYRTPNYMLSTSQAYRPSYGGDQHHIWQATLDDAAVCFTTHPGGYGDKAPDAYWHGNGYMPKAVQHKNVAIILYNPPSTPNVVLSQTLNFTHAFFPKARYDEVVEKNGWILARKNKGYIALYSTGNYQWQKEGTYAEQEVIVEGKKNAWIVEMGGQDSVGSFEQFVAQVSQAEVNCRGLNVTYQSPTLGQVKVGWRQGLKVEGTPIAVNDYKRYDNPFSQTEFGAEKIDIRYGTETYSINR